MVAVMLVVVCIYIDKTNNITVKNKGYKSNFIRCILPNLEVDKTNVGI